MIIDLGERRFSQLSLTFPADANLKDGSPVQLVLADERDVEPMRRLYRIIVDEGTSYPHDRFPNQDDFMGADARHMCGLFSNFGMRSFRNAKNVQDQGGPMPIMTAVALSMLLLAVTGCVASSPPSAAKQEASKKDSTKKVIKHDEGKAMNEESQNVVR